MTGLTPKKLRAWAGTDRLSELPLHRARLAQLPITPASRELAYFVAGVDVTGFEPPERLRGLAVLPLGESWIVCDRLDAPLSPELVCWPDDSSYHLACSIPAGKRESWLDLGTGSAFAPLLRRGMAKRVVGVDANPRAIAMARLGAELSGADIELRVADVSDLWATTEAPGPRTDFELVTCNAPIPDHTGPMWRATTSQFFTSLWEVCRRCAPDLVVVHGALPALATVPDLGERVTVSYSPGFGVLWWRPHAPSRAVNSHRELTPDRPHLDETDHRSCL